MALLSSPGTWARCSVRFTAWSGKITIPGCYAQTRRRLRVDRDDETCLSTAGMPLVLVYVCYMALLSTPGTCVRCSVRSTAWSSEIAIPGCDAQACPLHANGDDETCWSTVGTL